MLQRQLVGEYLIGQIDSHFELIWLNLMQTLPDNYTASIFVIRRYEKNSFVEKFS